MTTPQMGGYTPDTLMTEVTQRAMAQIQLEAGSRGIKLSARERDTLRTGVGVGAAHMFKIFGEIAREQTKS